MRRETTWRTQLEQHPIINILKCPKNAPTVSIPTYPLIRFPPQLKIINFMRIVYSPPSQHGFSTIIPRDFYLAAPTFSARIRNEIAPISTSSVNVVNLNECRRAFKTLECADFDVVLIRCTVLCETMFESYKRY
ncbi:hypothetical protein CEXT_555321 [Caerostris extrusa]|uniref:Uncharacterized protein n=1 Tax=Caerostris extrusa TaxID=172846 RepID=A0AAV4Q7D7_CAEEX|nr:hypothetical protein CEXT_555321 [Caerostris extrusa]